MTLNSMAKVLLAIALVIGLGGAAPAQGGTPPQITFLSFPPQIQADGNPVSGFVGFKDPDGDLAKAEFIVIRAKDFQPFTLDLNVRGAKEGSFEFAISTTTPQSVTLRLTLIDEAGNRSQPREFSFEAVGTGAILQVTPTILNFSEQVGRTPPSQTVQVANVGSGTLNWSASVDQPWIELSPTRGTAPSVLTVSLRSANLEVGSYAGNITIAAPGAQGSPAVVRVNLTVRPPAPPAVLEVSPRQLEFRGYVGGSNPTPQMLTLRNSGGQPLTWTAQVNAPWLSLSHSLGALQEGESTQVQVSVNLASLTAGTLQAQITFTAPEAQNSPVIVSVMLVVEAALPAVLEVSPLRLEFRGQEGGSNPVAQILTVRNSGGQPLTWTAQIDRPWVRLNPTTSSLRERESVQVYVYVELAGLSTGTHQAQITITAPGAQGSPVTVTVNLQVEPSGPRTLRVPTDFSTIRGAIEAAREGDTILIAAGTYRESLTIAKSLTLQGQARGMVIIQGNRQEPTIIITGAQNVNIMDLTVTDGSGGIGERGRGGGFHIENSTVTIRNVVIQDNLRHGLLAINESNVTIRDSQIINNRPSPDGYIGRGITLVQSAAIIENNMISGNALNAIGLFGSQARIRRNTVTDNGYGISLFDSAGRISQATIEGNTIERNGEEGVFVAGSSEAEIISNRIIDNKPDAEGRFGDGIEVVDNGKATIRNNTITGNARLGVGLWDHVRAILQGNTITKNKSHGVNIGYSGASGETVQAEFWDNVINDNGGCGLSIDDDPGIRIMGKGNETRGNTYDGICGPGAGKVPYDFWKR